MAVKSSELRSGVFVVLAVVALTILIFSVGNFRARLKSQSQYVTYVANAKFLKPHDPITYGGYKVGEIKALEVAPDRHGMVKITLAVDVDTPVMEDSVITVKQDGILGPKYLEVSPGRPGGKRAPSGAALPGIAPVAFVELGPSFEGPMQKLDTLLDNVNKIIGDEEFRKNVAAMLTDARSLLKSLADEIQKVGAAAGKTGERSQEVLGEVHETVKAIREPLGKTLKNTEELTGKLAKDADLITERIVKTLDELTARLNKSLDSLDQVLKDTDGLIVQNNKNLFETIRGMRDMTHHLELAAKRIRANPSIMLFGADETPEELRRADETELRLKGRARRYDKEEPK
jgi:phospholipid/cholesterol/gamma-HCH transport system substrate-binding protein